MQQVEKEFDEKFFCKTSDGVCNWRMWYGETPIEVGMDKASLMRFIEKKINDAVDIEINYQGKQTNNKLN